MRLLPKAVEFVDALWRELIDSEKAVIKETTLLTVESFKINIFGYTYLQNCKSE